ncbi:hypothetical protein Tsubulata_043662, partial [Turnera subulata]
MGSLEVMTPDKPSKSSQDKYEELETEVRKIKAQNSKLVEEIRSLSEECGKLNGENYSIK